MKKGKAFKSSGNLLLAVIGDEATVTGLLLTGMGERNKAGKANYFIVDKDTNIKKIEDAFKEFLTRRDIGIIMISQNVAEEIRHLVDAHIDVIPTILEIPSKDVPYDVEKDSIMQRASKQLYGSDEGLK